MWPCAREAEKHLLDARNLLNLHSLSLPRLTLTPEVFPEHACRFVLSFCIIVTLDPVITLIFDIIYDNMVAPSIPSISPPPPQVPAFTWQLNLHPRCLACGSPLPAGVRRLL